MSTSRLTVFCTPGELTEWLKAMSRKFDLQFLRFFRSQNLGSVVAGSEMKLDGSDVWRIMGFPANDPFAKEMDFNDVLPRKWGWLDVTPGELFCNGSTRELLKTTIFAEDNDGESTHPAKFVRWLKRQLKKEKSVTFGVKGRNTVVGGEGSCPDIGYTPGALKLQKEGVLWTQFRNGRIVFEPLAEIDLNSFSEKPNP